MGDYFDDWRIMRGSPAHLGGLSAVVGLLIAVQLAFFLGVFFLSLSLFGFILGIMGAWVLRKHRKVGSLAFLVGGFFPLVSGFILFQNQVPGYLSLQDILLDLLLFFWWCPLLILAGILGILNLPGKQPSPENGEEES